MKIATQFRWLLVLSLFPTFLFSQNGMNLKLQLMPDGQTWGVYVKPDDSISPSNLTITSWAQVTLVMPIGYQWSSLVSVSGNWAAQYPYDGVEELPENRIQYFTLLDESIPVIYATSSETLLFTFKGDGNCPNEISLWDENTQLILYPNDSWWSFNPPGNIFEVFDMMTASFYTYGHDYAPAAWDCHDNDNDGILNAHEDTNGNGIFDAGDASDLNTPDFASSAGGFNFKLQLMPDGDNWGVYVKPEDGLFPSVNTITGTSQVTVVMPKDYAWSQLESVSGTWSADAGVNGPVENPTKKYVMFGLVSDQPQINYQNGHETLLFTFRKAADCPNDLHLYSQQTDPMPSPGGYNLGNDIAVIDIGLPQFPFYTYSGNYALAAWDCHDNDGDGIPNALEDTNGNGIFDLGLDASDLNSADSALGTGCMKLKLQLLPDSSGWGVFAKPFDGYLPSANAVATGGRVTVVAPENFDFGGMENATGEWLLVSTLYGLPSNPSRKFLTFELTPNATNLGLSATEATLLFQFDKLGDCPDSLYLLENYQSMGLEPNEFSGFDPNSFTSSSFEYCGVYARKSWRCKAASTPGGTIIIVATEDSLSAPQTEAVDRDAEFSEGQTLAEGQSFTLAPNPAGSFVNITVSENLAEGQT
ncbi:MAG: hypothetical protein K9J37_10410, partial [Saprospiraceae bacterium]|nr:hypothetical protein [Saprospiraceae bacterium]MCF8250316.1 hypothetical protein [Saprospiraceae bacterium]MCF8312124.1 hypothetical protein [Saprospiraceae bacterium]